jgi:hypothetical protein
MQQEVANADAENFRIYAEFDVREKKTEELIRQQQHSYDLLLKTKIEKEVVGASSVIQEKTIERLKASNAKHHA